MIFLHQINSLPTHIKSSIPRSTLFSWKDQNHSRVIRCESLVNDTDTVAMLFRNVENKADLARLNKQVILETIQKTWSVLDNVLQNVKAKKAFD